MTNPTGGATLNASLQGSFDAPRLTGRAVVSNGRLRPLASIHSLEGINGPIVFDEAGVNLDGLRGRIGGGEVTFGGSIASEGYRLTEYNLTAVGTAGTNGFLAVEPGDASAFGGSTLNWSAVGITIANASTAKLDLARQLKVFCGGTSTSCHFIIDIVGYYL